MLAICATLIVELLELFRPQMKSTLTGANEPQVVDVKAFTANRNVQEFVQAVDKSNHIYNRRWGDASLRYALCQMFFDVATEINEFCELSYAHQGIHESTC